MFNLFLLSGVVYITTICILGGEKNSNRSKKCKNYPSGYELKRQLMQTPIYDYDISTLNYDLIQDYIFRDYVYVFEVGSGYSRDIALRKALDKYIKEYKILDDKYKF